MSWFALIANPASSSIASTLTVYASSTVLGVPPEPISRLTYLVLVHVVMLGVPNVWWVPLSNTYGRRPIVLTGLVIAVAASIWAKYATSLGSLLAARVFMGIGGGPADAVSPDVVDEIFFVHARGRAMTVYTVLLSLGSNIGGILGGYLVAVSFDWIHWMNVILAAVTLVLCFFFQSETLYERRHNLSSLSGLGAVEKPNNQVAEFTASMTIEYPPFTYLRSLKIGVNRHGLTQNFLNVFRTLRLPGVWLVSFWYAGVVGAMVAMSSSGTNFVSQPRYLWGKNAGLVNVGGLIGAVLGGLYTYLIVDRLTKRHAIRNKDGIG
ncbi:hypothetical protein ACN47E_007351 [Coniothyrium glycines]